MFRKQNVIWLSAVVFIAAVSLGCKPKEVEHPPLTDTPNVEDPVNPYTNDDYAAALRSASLKIRGQLPPAADTQEVLAEGRLAYEAKIDEYVESPEFVEYMHNNFKDWFGLGGQFVPVTDPYTGGQIVLNTSEPSNLAAYVLKYDLPWGEVFSADYCVDDNLNVMNDCTGGLPQDQRAGILTSQPLLRLYGKPEAFNFQRTSIAHQLMACEVYPDGGTPLVRTNAAAGTLPADNPADPPRIHAKYQGSLQGDDGEVFCATCHSSLLARRPAFNKFDIEGFYRPEFTILDIETPVENGDKCFIVPPGLTPADLKTCEDPTFDPQLDFCCYDEGFTDPNSSDAQWCADSDSDCLGKYANAQFSGPAEYVSLVMDESYSATKFYDCQTQRWFNYALGYFNGVLGLQAGGGAPPQYVGYYTVEKYRSTFARENYNARELLRALFKGDEFLSTQGG